MTARAKTTTEIISKRRLALTILVLISLLVCAAALAACGKNSRWHKLTPNAQGRYEQVADGELLTRTGIDVSEFQGSIDWAAVAKDDISYAFIRIGRRGSTNGDLYVDEFFEENFRDAKACGLKVGLYFFSQATTTREATKEAKFVLKTLNKAEIDLPIAYDFEFDPEPGGRANDLTDKQIAKNAKAFCKTIEKGGYRAMLYGTHEMLSKTGKRNLKTYPVWYAAYGEYPNTNIDLIIWQYDSQGSVAGINTSVDMNVMFLEDMSSLMSDMEEVAEEAEEAEDAVADDAEDEGKED